jgi:hypothetical protein
MINQRQELWKKEMRYHILFFKITYFLTELSLPVHLVQRLPSDSGLDDGGEVLQEDVCKIKKLIERSQRS